MSKSKALNELTTILAKSLRHKIGSMLHPYEIYGHRYAKDAQMLFKEAQKVSLREHWNREDKLLIKDQVRKKLRKELEERPFLQEKKFDLMEEEIKGALKILNLEI